MAQKLTPICHLNTLENQHKCLPYNGLYQFNEKPARLKVQPFLR